MIADMSALHHVGVSFYEELLSQWVAPAAYTTGNVARLAFVLVDIVFMKQLSEIPGWADFMKDLLSDGLCYCGMIMLTQVSLEDDCLSIDYLFNLKGFLTLWKYSTATFFYVVAVTPFALCN